MSGSNALQPRHHTVTRAVKPKSARVTGDRRRMVARNVARDRRHRTYLFSPTKNSACRIMTRARGQATPVREARRRWRASTARGETGRRTDVEWARPRVAESAMSAASPAKRRRRSIRDCVSGRRRPAAHENRRQPQPRLLRARERQTHCRSRSPRYGALAREGHSLALSTCIGMASRVPVRSTMSMMDRRTSWRMSSNSA